VRVTIRIEGKEHEVEFEPGASSVRIDGRTFPVRLLTTDAEVAEVEIAGEKVAIEGWPPGSPAPVGRLSVNGEVVPGFSLVRAESRPSSFPPAAPLTRPEGPARPDVSEGGPRTAVDAEAGLPVRPPMPGKVLEVRVANGDRVSAGQLLFVLEAMKMRNEVASPIDGTVAALAITAGASVRAKDIALRILPG
jgi:glutaconyl-CoA/methylmalonyl-CoA decarboxylase subunit gamma